MLGLTNVRVLEALPRAGGKSHTCAVVHPDTGAAVPYEAGTVWATPSALIDEMCRELGVAQRLDSSMLAVAVLAPGAVRPSNSLRRIADDSSVLSRLWQTREFFALLRRIDAVTSAGLAGAMSAQPALAAPLDVLLGQLGLPFIWAALKPHIEASLFGVWSARLPAVYGLRLVACFARASLASFLWRGFSRLAVGNGAVWSALAASLGDRVWFDAAVTSLSRAPERAPAALALRTADGRHVQCDAVVWAAPVPQLLAALAAGDGEWGAPKSGALGEERALLSRVRLCGRAVLVCHVPAWRALRGPAPPFVVRRAAAGADALAPHAVLPLQGDWRLAAFYCFLPPGEAPSRAALGAMLRGVRALVRRVADGAGDAVRLLRVHWHAAWLPHFDAAALAREDCHARLELLQGTAGLWYASELMAGIGVPPNAEYGDALAARLASLYCG